MPMSGEGQRAMFAAFREGKTAEEAAQKIRDSSGEQVATWVVRKRLKLWQEQQARRWAAKEQAEEIIADMKALNWGPAELIVALLTDALMMDPDSLKDGRALKVGAQNLAAERVRINRERLELEKKRVEMKERTGEVGGKPTASEKVQKVKEIYGL